MVEGVVGVGFLFLASAFGSKAKRTSSESLTSIVDFEVKAVVQEALKSSLPMSAMSYEETIGLWYGELPFSTIQRGH